jgi:hypothetical protein
MPPTPRYPPRRNPRRPRRSAVVARRRFVAVLVVCAAVAGVAAWVLAPDPQPDPTSRPAASTAPEKRDGDRQAPGLPLSRAIGRKIMTTMDGTFPSRSLRARVRRGEVGGVILFEPNVGPGLGRAIRSLQRNARAGGNPPLLIAVDQEGGLVKRFAALPPSQAPAQMDAAAAGTAGAAVANTSPATRARSSARALVMVPFSSTCTHRRGGIAIPMLPRGACQGYERRHIRG